MCDGGTGDLGHPAVYFKIDKNKKLFAIIVIKIYQKDNLFSLINSLTEISQLIF